MFKNFCFALLTCVCLSAPVSAAELNFNFVLRLFHPPVYVEKYKENNRQGVEKYRNRVNAPYGFRYRERNIIRR